MAIIKCKMCGGDLNLIEGQSVAQCEYCGSRQTVPVADDEKKLNLFVRAGRLRTACEFDKAAGIYETIIADFPDEAESYWGLVLCKYGIEYVDDPQSGKKIPTCHRSSFDSVMDDPNFEQAMDYADDAARKVYREEAKQLEQIRRGILEVSSNEKPYDIFICYKETDENGERTLDSVLAQDLYSALTGKGYRVFFSRITLQSKLGQAYEPYIFAALNSAKVMLAIGTDPEYYNAVWVRNEWSRYLKICAADNTKYLIPCYKGLDAYDLPKEFRPLQGVDLGKMGAVQDILFNMEKYIPLQKETAIVREKVVVGGTGSSNKVSALLERGNMALEDGDWAKADSFFEDVLNNDPKNAQAYIGKTLAQERCRTMEALIRKRKDAYQNVRPETLYIKENTAHIHQITEQYSLNGYVSADSIRDLYKFDPSYSSEVSGRQKQYREEESWWQNHKQLSRAEKFAAGAVAEHLQSEKKHLFAQLAERVKKAQEADAKAIAKLEAQYDAHIAEADKRAEEIYNDGLTRREADYQKWLERAKEENNPETLNKLATKFDDLGTYKDSRNLAEHCRKRAADEQATIDAENERKAEAARQAAAAQAKRNKTISMIAAIVAVVTIAVALVVTKVIIPNGKYNDAVALMDAGQYEEAIAAFEAMDGYKDSLIKIEECGTTILDGKYNDAIALMDAGKYEEAIATFDALGTYKDSAKMIPECNYRKAVALANAGDTLQALREFDALGKYKDAQEQVVEQRKLYQKKLQPATIGIGYRHTVALKADGTVVAVGSNEHGQCNVSGWKDIVAISASGSHTVGLKADGTVIAVGWNEYGQCNVSGWTDIIAIDTAGSRTIGLKADGTVLAIGEDINGETNVSGWTDIVAISAGLNHTVGLKADGTVMLTGWMDEDFNLSGCKDIVAISAGTTHIVGLKADGTVVSVSRNGSGQCNVSGWTDIIAISAGQLFTVGLKADGTVVSIDTNGNDRYGVAGWTDIVGICADAHGIVGLKENGSVVAAGDGFIDQFDISGWTNVVAVGRDYSRAVGLKADGTVVAVGNNEDGQCDVSGWTNIKLP